MKQVNESELLSEIDFARHAADAFAADPRLASYSDPEDLEPGALLALRWGLGNDCVLVMRLDDMHVPTIYAQIITRANMARKAAADDGARAVQVCCRKGQKGWCIHTQTMLCAVGLDGQKKADSPADGACTCGGVPGTGAKWCESCLQRLQTNTAIQYLKRGMHQLRAWHEWYGRRQPDALPPPGDVRWLEDVDAFIKKGGA